MTCSHDLAELAEVREVNRDEDGLIPRLFASGVCEECMAKTFGLERVHCEMEQGDRDVHLYLTELGPASTT